MKLEFLTPDIAESPTIDAIAITSANAVAGLALHPRFAVFLLLPVFAVGDRSAEMARQAGFAGVTSAAGDADDLVRLLEAELDISMTVLYAAGRDRTGDLAARLENAGLQVITAEFYKSEAIDRLDDKTIADVTSGHIDCVLNYSARSSAALVNAAERSACLAALRHIPALAISDQAAVPLRNAGWRSVIVAPNPTEAALLALISTITAA